MEQESKFVMENPVDSTSIFMNLTPSLMIILVYFLCLVCMETKK